MAVVLRAGVPPPRAGGRSAATAAATPTTPSTLHRYALLQKYGDVAVGLGLSRVPSDPTLTNVCDQSSIHIQTVTSPVHSPRKRQVFVVGQQGPSRSSSPSLRSPNNLINSRASSESRVLTPTSWFWAPPTKPPDIAGSSEEPAKGGQPAVKAAAGGPRRACIAEGPPQVKRHYVPQSEESAVGEGTTATAPNKGPKTELRRPTVIHSDLQQEFVEASMPRKFFQVVDKLKERGAYKPRDNGETRRRTRFESHESGWDMENIWDDDEPALSNATSPRGSTSFVMEHRGSTLLSVN